MSNASADVVTDDRDWSALHAANTRTISAADAVAHALVQAWIVLEHEQSFVRGLSDRVGKRRRGWDYNLLRLFPGRVPKYRSE